jgi:hypothetical protein
MPMMLSMVMLRGDADLSAGEIASDLAAKWPDLPAVSEQDQGDGTVAFRVGESDVILGKMPAPIPWSDLEGPCATSILWRNASEDIKAHTTHWIVTVSGEQSPIEQSMLLSQVTASVMTTCAEAIGVYWGNATLVVPKATFVEFAERVLPLGPPIDIWVDFRVGRDGETSSSGFSTGMKALGHMEIEAKQSPEPPGELRDRIVSIARYVLENGPVIKDGDTIGEDENERIRVVYSNSAFGQKGTVMRLKYEAASPQKPWWKLW